MNKNPLVSIILPTYNVARFLKQCLDSLNIQTYTNYECIIIVDGATDGSYEIAKEYCESHDKFTVYWQENAGSGPARNNGIDHANGELIMFIDPDDWVEPDYIERHVVIQQEGDYDFTFSQRRDVFCTSNGSLIKAKKLPAIEITLKDRQICRSNYFSLLERDLVNAPTRIVYKREIICAHSVCFPELRRSQDVVFNYRYFDCINSLAGFDYDGYNYRIVAGENIGRVKADHYKILEILYKDICQLLNRWNVSLSKERVANYFFRIVYTCLLSNISTQSSISPILKSDIVNDIIIKAHPSKAHFVITRWLLLSKQYFLLSIFMRVIYRIKMHKES